MRQSPKRGCSGVHFGQCLLVWLRPGSKRGTISLEGGFYKKNLVVWINSAIYRWSFCYNFSSLKNLTHWYWVEKFDDGIFLIFPDYLSVIIVVPKFTHSEWCDLASETLIIIGSVNGLSPGSCPSVIWTNDDLLLIESLWTRSLKFKSW